MIGILVKAGQALVKLARNPVVRQKVVQTAKKAGEVFKNVSRQAVQKCQVWARNRSIRKAYNANERLLKQEIKQMRVNGASSKSIAEKAHAVRKNGRLQAREQMRKNGDGDLVKKLQARDLKKYNNKDGPNFEQIVKKTKSDLTKKLGKEPTQEQIHNAIGESATRTDFLTNLKFLTF
jgi:hypothetical protein